MTDKQHEASEQQRRRFQDEGDVARSADITRILVLGFGVSALVGLGAKVMQEMSRGTAMALGNLSGGMRESLPELLPMLAWGAGPVALAGLAGGIASVAIQTKGDIKLSHLGFKLEKLNPLPRLKQMFMSVEAAVTISMSITKVSAVAGVCIWSAIKDVPELLGRSYGSLGEVLAAGGLCVGHLVVRAGIAMAVLAIADYAISWFKLERKMRMSTQQLRDDMKEEMGDPQVRGRRRRKQRELVEQRSLKAVPTSDVVVVNPTHFSIALKYDANSMGAPRVVAKGVDEQAKRIRTLARQSGVPVVSQPPLARMLYRRVKVGKPIPGDLYKAVASVLAYVYGLRRRRT